MRALLVTGCLATGAMAQEPADAARRTSEGTKAVTLLKELIRMDSSTGDTTHIAAHLEALFEPLGAQVEVVLARNGKAAHFFARIKSDGSKRPVLLAAHTDGRGVEADPGQQQCGNAEVGAAHLARPAARRCANTQRTSAQHPDHHDV